MVVISRRHITLYTLRWNKKNYDNGMLSQIALLKQKVVAMGKQVNLKQTNSDASMSTGNNNNTSNDNHNNNNNILNSSGNGFQNNSLIILSQILSSENTNVNANSSNTVSSSNQVMSTFITFNVYFFLIALDCVTGRRNTFRSDGKVFGVTENCTDNTKTACILKSV